jgi:hypothetical protein
MHYYNVKGKMLSGKLPEKQAFQLMGVQVCPPGGRPDPVFGQMHRTSEMAVRWASGAANSRRFLAMAAPVRLSYRAGVITLRGTRNL